MFFIPKTNNMFFAVSLFQFSMHSPRLPMKNRYFSLILVLLFTTIECVFGQSASLNLDFEDIRNNMPVNWQSHNTEDFHATIDSVNVLSGKYSVSLESSSDQKYGKFAIKLPSNIDGRNLTFSGFIKAEVDPANHIIPYISI